MGIGAYRHRVELVQPSAPPAVVMPTSTRWRVNISEPGPVENSGGWVGFCQISMASEPGGPDLCTGGTPLASSEWSIGFPVSRAFDHDPTTYWSSGDHDVALPMPQWVEYEFPSPVSIVEYRLQAEDTDPPYYPPAAWTFEYWDGSAWVVVDSQAGQLNWTLSETRTFAVVSVVTPVVWDCSMQSVATQVVDGLAGYYIRGRFLPGITLETQILFEGRTFQVQAITDVDERHTELQLYCVEVVGRHGSVHA